MDTIISILLIIFTCASLLFVLFFLIVIFGVRKERNERLDDDMMYNAPGKSIPMQCEYGNCKRNGYDYVRPPHLAEPGWDNEPIYLCADHARELKVTQLITK